MTVGRFAPSPSGRIHLGNILCSLPEFATYEMRNPKPGKGLGYFEA